MGKRASARPAPATAKASKVAKVQDKKDIPWQPALDAIQELSGLNKACREMLLNAVPHSRPGVDQQPHAYQRQVLDSIEQQLEETEALRQKELRQVEQRISDLEAEKQQNAADLTNFSKEVSDRKEAWDKAKALYKDESAVAVTQADMTEKKAKEDNLVGERTALEKQLEELRQVIAEAWKPLKEGNPAFFSRNWRAGRKATDRVMEMLRQAAAPDSMMQAVQVSLSQKPAERQEFASMTLEHAEKALSNSEAVLAARLAGFDDEAASRSAASAAAKEAWQAAKMARQELWQASIDAENSWAEEQSRVFECSRKEKSFANLIEDLFKERAKLLAALQKTQGTLAVYKSWRSPAAAAKSVPADVAEVEVGEEGEAATEEAASAVAEAPPSGEQVAHEALTVVTA